MTVRISLITSGSTRRIDLIHLEVFDKIHPQILGVSYYHWILACWHAVCAGYTFSVCSNEVWKHI